MTKKFRKRISIKWILLPAVLAAAIVVPAAQADPWPFVQYESTPTSVRAALEELGSAASPVTAPSVATQKLVTNPTNVRAALEELGTAASPSSAGSGGSINHFLTGQVSTAPVVDGHHQALLDKKQAPAASPGVIADGLRYQALAQHYEQLAGLNAYSQRYVALAKHYEQLAGIKADGLRYTALAKKFAQPSTPQAIGNGTSFQWGDAATGFGAGIGLIVLMSVVGFAVVGTRNRTAPA